MACCWIRVGDVKFISADIGLFHVSKAIAHLIRAEWLD